MDRRQEAWEGINSVGQSKALRVTQKRGCLQTVLSAQSPKPPSPPRLLRKAGIFPDVPTVQALLRPLFEAGWGKVFVRCRDQGKGIVDKHDTGRFSPLNLSWSPGYTRLFYSNQNSCTHPWRLQNPGSPWQPSDPGRLEPTCTGTGNQV